jgi:PAS domain S-box-containing protein
LTHNAQEDERFHERQSIVGYALRSIMAVPLKVRGEILGAVYCDNRVLQGLFQQHELELLTAFTHQAAVALDNVRLFEEARAQLEAVSGARDLMENTFASISSAVITTDQQGRVATLNAAARQVLGLADASVSGTALNEILPPMEPIFYDALESVAQTGRGQRLEVTPVMRGRGERVWNVAISVLGAVAGQSRGIALVIDDLSEQRAREAQLAEVKRYLPLALVNNIRSVDDIDTRAHEREITALFADVRGFTSFSEKLPPDALMRIITRYLSVASDSINLYEGIVDKYMGDAVTGLFNTQLNPQRDHAVRAVQAAMTMMYDLYALHEVLPEEQRLFYGVGIHTGMAVLGSVGSADRREFAVLGEASDISKILQENAHGSVIVSPQTYAYIRDAFECEEVALTKTKGLKDLTIGYKVTKRKKASRTANLFVDSELADLLKD